MTREFEEQYTYLAGFRRFLSPEKTCSGLGATAQEVSCCCIGGTGGSWPAADAPGREGHMGCPAGGNLKAYYTYLVTWTCGPGACTPCRAVGVNGNRAMVLDFKSTDRRLEMTRPFHREGHHDAVLYTAPARPVHAPLQPLRNKASFWSDGDRAENPWRSHRS